MNNNVNRGGRGGRPNIFGGKAKTNEFDFPYT